MMLRIAIGFGGAALEGWAAWLLFEQGRPGPAFAAHAVACVLLSAWGIRYIGQVKSLPGAGAWFFGVMIPVPVAGPALAVALLAAMRIKPERAKAESRVVVGIPGGVAASASAPGTRARSIIEVLASPDTLARREAVLSLRSEISPAAVLILQKAVGDSDEQVRNYAQSQLAKWTEQAELNIKRLTALAGSPDAPAEVLLALAESLREMVTIHLAGPELAKKFLRRSLEWLEKIPAESAVRGNADVLALRCHLRLREAARAREVLQRVEVSGYAHESLAGLRLRVLFHERNWLGLRKELRREMPEVPPEIVQSRRFWEARAAA
ncbi:MAG: hypothetical protein WCS65_00585 [Verrucomicrobiae bacterium]